MSSWPFGASHGQAEIIATGCGGKDLRILGCHKKESRDTLFEAHLIDGILVLDAGGLTRSLTFEEQENIQTIALLIDTSTTSEAFCRSVLPCMIQKS